MSENKNEMGSEGNLTVKKPCDSEFVCKLCDMMEKYSDIVCWSPDGKQLIFTDLIRMQKLVLPVYFRHSNFASFVRQLNMYNFHKLYKKENLLSFQNEIFQRGNQRNYHFIQRKRKNKQQQNYSIKFESEYENTLKKIKTSSELSNGAKSLLVNLIEYKYTAIQNIKKIKQHIETICKELKQSRSKKVNEIVNQLKSSNMAEINENIHLAKEIDQFMEAYFCSEFEHREKINSFPSLSGFSHFPIQYVQNVTPIILEENKTIKELDIENKQSFKSQNSLINLPSMQCASGGELPEDEGESADSASFSIMEHMNNANQEFQNKC